MLEQPPPLPPRRNTVTMANAGCIARVHFRFTKFFAGWGAFSARNYLFVMSISIILAILCSIGSLNEAHLKQFGGAWVRETSVLQSDRASFNNQFESLKRVSQILVEVGLLFLPLQPFSSLQSSTKLCLIYWTCVPCCIWHHHSHLARRPIS